MAEIETVFHNKSSSRTSEAEIKVDNQDDQLDDEYKPAYLPMHK